MILQDFLVCGLLDIGEDEKRLEWLEKASEGLAKELLKSKHKLINYTLVALDDDLPENEPVFAEVEAAVTEYWKALRGRFPETPRQLLRAVILAALEGVKDDSTATSIIWLIGGGFLPYAHLTKERLIVENIIRDMGDRAEKAAFEVWATVRPSKEPRFPTWTAKLEALKKGAITPEWLQQRLGPAAGSGAAVEGFPNNPHQTLNHPTHVANWANHFASYAAQAISQQINAALKPFADQVTAALSQLEEPLKNHGAAVSAAVRESIRQGVESQLAQEKRTALLWWQRTLYSPSRRRSYRGLAPAPVTVLMAHDLHNEVPSMAPQSVEFLLREAVREAVGADIKLSGEKFLNSLLKDEQGLAFQELLGPVVARHGRICLSEFVREVLNQKASIADLPSRVGIPLAETLSAEDWSVWLFRNNQALRLATTK